MRDCIFLMNMPVPTYSLDRASGLLEMHVHQDVEFFHHPLAGIVSHSVSDICEPECWLYCVEINIYIYI